MFETPSPYINYSTGRGLSFNDTEGLYVVRLQLDQLRVTHRQVFEATRDQGIGVNLHYIPVHTQPFYRELGFQLGDCPVAEKYYQEALTLPLFPGMNEEDQDRVVGALKRILPTEYTEEHGRTR
ncbi:DegT/DnrJ/EryC1/StrS family aminotransferase [Desulfonatronum thioautotrophicum]|uniref:DegT/DnrJ/EryC1/StrS family aminotransferase n=1 Tax=Desulfonatronum thioautotrophicum TaxID=617001 RepID=UPI0005EBB003|nr:DegT/DnrJ/EryC1/StrS family aminotransferase [Desulfonatronum thioautotrophicum]